MVRSPIAFQSIIEFPIPVVHFLLVPWRRAVFVNLSRLHDEHHAPERGDVFQGIPVDADGDVMDNTALAVALEPSETRIYKDGAAMLSNDLKTTGINDFRCCRPERVPQRKM